MFIIGLDPSTTSYGAAALQLDAGRISLIGCSAFLSKKKAINERIYEIAALLESWISGLSDLGQPMRCAQEDAFVPKIMRTNGVIALGKARGIAPAHYDGVAEYPASTWRAAFCGNGHATKEDALATANLRFSAGLSADKPGDLDCAEAIGVAYCHAMVLQGTGDGKLGKRITKERLLKNKKGKREKRAQNI